MAFCTKCGTRFEAGTSFCGNCGAAVAAAATLQPSFSTDAPQAGSADNVATAEMKFIGENYDYFNRKWRIGKQSWNWAAFFLTLPWLAYRKMYLYCWIYIGAEGVLTIAQYAFSFPNRLSVLLGFGIASTFGRQGNSCYKYHVQKKLKELAAMNMPEQADIELVRQGGTNIGSAIGFMVLALAILLLIGYAGEEGLFTL